MLTGNHRTNDKDVAMFLEPVTLWAIDRIVMWLDPSWMLRYRTARLLDKWGWL